MTTEIVEIFTDIVDELNEEASFGELSKKLRKKSYRSAAATAYSWIFDKIIATKIADNITEKENVKNFRFFSPAEMHSLGRDNINFLLKLYNLGFISKKEIEQLMEQLKYFPEGEIAKEHISWLVLTSFFEINNVTLPGSRLLLYSSDTIN